MRVVGNGPRRTAILLILINKTSKRCHICVYLLFGGYYGVIKVKKNKNGYTCKWVFFFSLELQKSTK